MKRTRRAGTVGQGDKGRFEWKDGSYYEGQVKGGLFEGYGILNQVKDKRYEGEWKEGKMHGNGTLSYESGDYYKGSFFKGKKHGKGFFQWAKDTSYYEGEWYNNMPHGIGYVGKDNSSKKKAMYEGGEVVAWLDKD